MSALDIVAPQSDALVPASFQDPIIVNMTAALLRQPSPPCLLRAPTGSGKTFMLTSVLGRVTETTPTVWLWFVPFANLVQQTEDALLANAGTLTPVMLNRGRNQEPRSGMVMLSTAQAVARARDRKAGYAADGDDEVRTLADMVALACSRGLRVGLVVDEAHIGLDHGTEFGQFAHWLAPDYLLMASATPKDTRLDEFLVKAGKHARESFTVSRAQVVKARLNKRYIEAVVYDLRHSIVGIADLKRTVLRQAWLRHQWLKQRLQAAGLKLTPLLLVQVGNGEKTVEEAERDLVRLCKVPPGMIGKHSADDPDPVLMAAIASDQTKEVLIFKQSAGTGFDAPRAFVLASTKPVNDADFAMQFIGRVIRVAPAVRQAFAEPAVIPPELDTAYVYLADAQAQQGFQSAVNASLSVKDQLEGQTEQMVTRHTASGATVYSNQVTPQLPVIYEGSLPGWEAPAGSVPTAEPPQTGPQTDLFGNMLYPTVAMDTGSIVMGWDRVIQPGGAAARDNALPESEQALLDKLAEQRLRAYRRNVALRAAPTVLQCETRPILADMARVSREAAAKLPIADNVAEGAVRGAYNLIREKEIRTELTSHQRREEDVAIVTDRAALLREAESALRRLPQIEDEDVHIIVATLAERLRPFVEAPPTEAADAALDERQLARLARDAACWVIRREAQALGELLQEHISAFASVNDAARLPDVMLHPLQHALKSSRKNLYGAFPPDKATVDAERDGLDIDAQGSLAATALPFAGGMLHVGSYDATAALNKEEHEFAEALDRADFVVWWHRNPDRKPYSVRLVRAEHSHYFYPDFIVCLEHLPGTQPVVRLIETKESTKDAARKSQRVPKIYSKVMFVTRDQERLRIVNDDGSLGASFHWDDLEPARQWLAGTADGGNH